MVAALALSGGLILSLVGCAACFVFRGAVPPELTAVASACAGALANHLTHGPPVAIVAPRAVRPKEGI